MEVKDEKSKKEKRQSESPIQQMIAKDAMSKDNNDADFKTSLQQSVGHTRDAIVKLVSEDVQSNSNGPVKVSVNDAYGNTVTATGTKDKVQTFTSYGFSNDTLNFPLWLALYNDSWVFRRAIDKPAKDMVRCGITLHLTDNAEKPMREYKRLSNKLIDLVKWGALFGGSVAVILTGVDQNKFEKQLSDSELDKDKPLQLYVTDRWYGVACSYDDVVSDITDIDYGYPKYYQITFADGVTVKVHYSRILRYNHLKAPNIIEKGYLQGWGYAEGSHILNELSRDDQLKSAITSLVNKSLIEVIKMSGMRGVFNGAVDEQSEQQLRKRLEMVNWGRTFNSLTFLDKDDDYQSTEFSVSGLSDMLEKNMRLVSAALDMQGILFGDLDGGFSADTVAMERYDGTIQERNESLLRPIVTKLLSILYRKYGIKKEVDFDFNSLLMKHQDEQRLDSLSKFQTIISGMLSDGILDVSMGAKSMQTYTEKGVIDFGLNEEAINRLKKLEEESMENIDFDEDTKKKKK